VKSILRKQDPQLFKAIQEETQREAWTLELIARKTWCRKRCSKPRQRADQ